MAASRLWTLSRSTLGPGAAELEGDVAGPGFTCTTTWLTNTHGISPKESSCRKHKFGKVTTWSHNLTAGHFLLLPR